MIQSIKKCDDADGHDHDQDHDQQICNEISFREGTQLMGSGRPIK